MSFNARILSLMLPFLLLALAGCEKRPDEEPRFPDYMMLRPTNNANVTAFAGQKIKVRYGGGDVNLSNIYLELNGVDVTGEFGISDVTDQAKTDMINVRNALVDGRNTLVVGQKKLDALDNPVLDTYGRPILRTSKAFYFFFDATAPRLTVNTVTPSTSNPDGSPMTGSTITVNGDIVDASLISNMSFAYPGGSVALTQTSANPVGTNQYNNTTKTYSVDLPNYPDNNSATSSAHFSYSVTDQFGHTGSQSFVASGTPVNRQRALQINDTLPVNLEPMASTLVNNGLILANAGNVFGLGKPLRLGSFVSPSPGDLMENPLTNCQPSQDVPGVEECIPAAYGGTTRVFIYPSDMTTCASLLFNSNAGVTHCVIFLTNINLDGPRLDVDFKGSGAVNDLDVIAGLHVGNAGANVEVAGIRVECAGSPVSGMPIPCGLPNIYYQGGLKGIVFFSNFDIYTDIKLYPEANYLVGMKRQGGFHMHLNDLLKVPQVYGSCNICSPYINPFVMVALALGADLSGNGAPDKKDLVAAIEAAVESKAGPLVDALLDAVRQSATTITTNIPVNDKQIINYSQVLDTHTVYGNNAHMVFSGSDSVDPMFYSPQYAPVNGGLGSVFQTPGNYFNNLPWINGWPITINGQKVIDLTYTVSANSVNQWLLANHQTGMFDEFELMMTGADIAMSGISVDPADNLSLTVNTHEAPSVTFISQDTSAAGICINTDLFCWQFNTASPGAIRFSVNDIDLHLDNVSTTQVLVDANMNISFELTLGVSSGRPSFTLKENSVVIHVNSMTMPDPLIYSPSFIAYALSKGIESFIGSATFNNMFTQKSLTVALADLPGMGGSGVNCAGPSVTGEICVAGNQVPYSSFLVGAIPRDFALLLRTLTIEPTGSYMTLSLDMRQKAAGTWTFDELQSNFLTLHITN